MKYENETKLSKEVWWIKRSNYTPKIEWKILRVSFIFNIKKILFMFKGKIRNRAICWR